MSDYKFLAKDYEYLNPKEEIFKQKYFFKEMISRYSPKNCLDCACGTGWHLYMLDELGLKCFGSDLSSEMLSIAKENTRDRRIILKECDYRFLDRKWDIKFDMIICMSNSFRHLIEKNEIIKGLNSMYERLNDGGILIIDNGLSDKLIDKKIKFIPARIHRDQAFYFVLEYPNEKEIVFNVLNVKKTKKSFDHSFETMRLSSLKKKGYENYLKKMNFKKVNYFGGFSLTSFSSSESKRMIIVAEK